MASRGGGENYAITVAPNGDQVGFHLKLTDGVVKELQRSPDSDAWTLTFDAGLKRAVSII